MIVWLPLITAARSSIVITGREWGLFIRATNGIFSALHVLEMGITIAGVGWKVFAIRRRRVFDLAVVLVGVLEVILVESLGGRVTALRAVRVLRLIKLVRQWRVLARMDLAPVAHFGVLLCLFVLIYAVLGLQFFAGKMTDPSSGVRYRSNFDSIGWSILTVFQIITTEEWYSVRVVIIYIPMNKCVLI